MFPLVRAALAHAQPHPKLGKAEGDDDSKPTPGLQPDGSIITEMGTVVPAAQVAEILAAIGDEDFALVEGALTPDVIEAFKKAGYTEVQRITTFSQDPKDILDVLDKEAVLYAEERGGELITQLADATRDKVRGTIEDALKEGWSKQEFSAELQANYAFSPQRADMIAHTELAFAHSYGRVEPMKAGGATKKKWLLSADHDPEEDCYCSEAAEAGWIDIDDNFVDDDDYDYPPGHPNCWCDWVSNLAGGDEDDDDGGEGEGGADGGDDGGAADKAAGVSLHARCAVGESSARELHKSVRGIFARLERLRARRDPDGIEAGPFGTKDAALRGSGEGSGGCGNEGEDEPQLAGDSESPTSTKKAVSELTKYPIDEKAHEAALSPTNSRPDPTDAQRSAGNYKMGHIVVGGLSISIENPAGTPRKPGWTPIAAHYGYFKRTTGADGDHVDVFVRPGTEHDWTGTVYVVDQHKLNGDFDEHKVLLGYDSKESAVQAYLDSYQPGWKLGPVSSMSWGAFCEWLRSGDLACPVYLSAAVMKGDVSGHEFHGNQYTGGGGSANETKGPKPTTATVAGAKGGVHELLSSGHSFTLEELHHATGASISNLKTALSDLKSDKYAGKYGKLEITKNPDGTYQVKGGGAKSSESSTPKPTGVGKPQYGGTKTAGTKLSNAQIAQKYQNSIYTAMMQLKQSDGGYGALQQYKDQKAQAMSDWHKDMYGDAQPQGGQKVTLADQHLYADLKSGMGYEQAHSQWKSNNAKEAQGTLKPVAGTKPISDAPKPSAAPTYAKGPLTTPIESSEHTRGIGTVRSEGFPQVSAQDFEPRMKDGFKTSDFAENLAQFHATLQSDYNDHNNPYSVYKGVQEELKNSPNYQAMAKIWEKNAGGGDNLAVSLKVKWDQTSGDHDLMANAVQLAAARVFGMSDADTSYKSLGLLQSGSQSNAIFDKVAESSSMKYYGSDNTVHSSLSGAVVEAGLKEYVAAQYRNTQNYLASKGLSEVYVARGMKIDTEEGLSQVKLQPLSAMTTRTSMASSFAGSNGRVFLMKIPASQVYSAHPTGPGVRHEDEVVVIGGLKNISAGVVHASKAGNTLTDTSKHMWALLSKDNG